MGEERERKGGKDEEGVAMRLSIWGRIKDDEGHYLFCGDN